MTTTDITTITPPANYPPPGWREGLEADTLALEWREDPADYFYVPEQLRAFYASSKTAPDKRQRQRLYETFPMPGGEAIEVDRLVLEADGRYVKADPIQMIHGAAVMFDPLKGRRQPMIRVDPHQPRSLAMRIWEHDIRLQRSPKMAEMAEINERNHQMDLLRVCPICKTANPIPSAAINGSSRLLQPITFGDHGWRSIHGQSFCPRCSPAVEHAVTMRHYEQYRQEIDTWVDGHVTEHQPKPPQRL